MNKTRKHCFIESVDNALTSVEMAMNVIDDLYNEKAIDQQYVSSDLEKAFYDLEINLTMLAIILRKMAENSYLELPDELRYDLNSLIHSSKFEYEHGQLKSFSKKGEEILALDKIIEFARKVIEEA